MSRSINPMCSLFAAPGLASLGFAPERLIVLMSLRPAIPRRVSLLHCSLPLHRAIAMVKEVVGHCQPPLGRGWGIFSWRFGEISIGVDTFANRVGNRCHSRIALAGYPA